MFGGDVRPTHRDSDRFRQIADPFSKTSRFWTLFTQWVCTLATTPPQLAAPPPPNGGNCIIRAATRRRYSASQLLMLQNPHHSKPEVRRIVYKSLAQHRLVRRNSSSTPQTTDFRPFFVRRANFFALTPTIRPSRANFFAHRTPPAATMRSSPVEWCNRFVSFGVGYALSWSGGSSCPVGWGVSRDLVRMSRLR